MTPKEAFASGGQNPNSRLWVRDWYAVGCEFFDQAVQHEGRILCGLRILEMLDVASHYHMGYTMKPAPPAALQSEELIEFLAEKAKTYGVPRCGIVISHSLWLSSTDLALNEDTATRGAFLQKYNIEFGPMADDDKNRVRVWIESLGIRCEFDGNSVGNE